MLLGGLHATAFMRDMAPYGMDLVDYSPEIGRASSVKMCRSVMIKGLEALTTECMLTARHYGVEADVLHTLGDTLPHPGWPGSARYVISRTLIHGKRRAEEMREVFGPGVRWCGLILNGFGLVCRILSVLAVDQGITASNGQSAQLRGH